MCEEEGGEDGGTWRVGVCGEEGGSMRRRVGFLGGDICGRGLEVLGSRCFFFVGRRGERA